MTIDDGRGVFKVRPGYWFAPRAFGFGATPVTWQGWAMVAGFIAIALGVVTAVTDDATKIGILVAVALPFTAIVWMKTDGGWRWHWGWRR